MTLEELEKEMKDELWGDEREKHLCLNFAYALPVQLHFRDKDIMAKEAIVKGLRDIRERMLFRIDDLICWAREEDK